MKILILTLFGFLLMCNGETDSFVEYTYWYIDNQSSEDLYFYSSRTNLVKICPSMKSSKVQILMHNGRIDTYNALFYSYLNEKDLESFLCDELVLLDSQVNILRKWTYRDKDMDVNHPMSRDAWDSCQYKIDNVARMEWTYTITSEDLRAMRGS